MNEQPPYIKAGLSLALAALSFCPPVLAENFARGQELYENHCQSCHEDLLHARNRKLKSLEALKERIKAWAVHSGTPWTAEEIDDVLYYLNKSFYRFDQKPL